MDLMWPHGIFVDKNGYIYCTSDDHTVKKFGPDGKLLVCLGNKNRPSRTGCVNKDYRTIRRASGPFHHPTDVACDEDGNLYVADGYGNARVHKFSKEGELILSWGRPGGGPGEFRLPHGIYVDRSGIVYVADRENNRIQCFDSEGKFIRQWDANRPTDVFVHGGAVYVPELGYYSGPRLISSKPKDGVMHPRFSIFTPEGDLLSRWGGSDGYAPGSFVAPHCVAVDSKGDIYVGETSITGGTDSFISRTCRVLQKFMKKRSTS
jgi:DNA-binding beta-propeller fold protein YncE